MQLARADLDRNHAKRVASKKNAGFA